MEYCTKFTDRRTLVTTSQPASKKDEAEADGVLLIYSCTSTNLNSVTGLDVLD